MRERGLEPPRPFGHKILSLARLPVPPLPQDLCRYYTRDGLNGGVPAGARAKAKLGIGIGGDGGLVGPRQTLAGETRRIEKSLARDKPAIRFSETLKKEKEHGTEAPCSLRLC